MTTISRSELYHEIWREPVRTVAERYNISDVALAKACRKYHIPVPPRGYWAKVRAGHRPGRPPLPQYASVEGQRIAFEADGRPELAVSQQAASLIEAEKREEATIHVADHLVDPHPHVLKVSKSLRVSKFARPEKAGMLTPQAKGRLDISVFPPTVDRALRIMDAVIKALELRGWPVEVDDDEAGRRSTSAVVLEERIFFFLEEKTARTNHVPTAEEKAEAKKYSWQHWPKWDFKPSGLLRLRIHDSDYLNVRSVWSDGDKQRLETLLNDFVIGLVRTAEAFKRQRVAHEEAQKRRREEEARRAEEQWKRHLDEQRARELARQVDALDKVARIRTYIERAREVKRVYLPLDELKIKTLDQWLEWVTDYANRIDPFAQRSDAE